MPPTRVTGAMVMAAGLGKRMRPLTATQPKPLVRVAGRALIDHTLDKLGKAGITDAVVNVHYLADALEAHLSKRTVPPRIQISDERSALLETGGGLVKAEPMIASDPFLAVNSDNLWTEGPVDAMSALIANWDDARMDALLLVVRHASAICHKGQGDFHMDPRGVLTRRKPGRVAPFVFTGVQLVSKRLLRDPPSGAFSTNVFWDRAIAERRLYGIAHQGLWFDVGTPAAIPMTETLLHDL